MYVVLGASGNTGHVVANNLLAGGQKVRVVGRNSAHLQPLTAKGAEAFIADVTDATALAKAFHGADSAYVMIPPNVTSSDPLGYSNRVSDAIAFAVQNAGIKNVVTLSSVGGQAIGKSDLKYVQAPDDQFRGVLVQMGMSEPFAKLLVEMIGALNSGQMRALEPRTPQNTTPTTFETFVAEYFVPAYQQQAAA